ncbi:MAG: DNA gyrase subunit A [Nitrospinae bacterium]|nr:DNA gyrase subunit A [Nitrospinota bacterium]
MEHENLRQIPVNIEDEMRSSYLDYAMSVIVGRALPDVRDGLKPVHRRALFAMHEMGNTHSKAYKKSARIVGDVIGKYHPHGDTAVYDTIVRLAQDFSMRYPLVDGQGNFGSIDGDAAAAMRYTEVRMHRLSDEMTADLDKDTVDFSPNYDASLQEPVVLPCRFPNLLVNGSSGIAVGMTTNIPPHNLVDTCKAVNHIIDNPDCTVDDLINIVKGPDFPTAGIIRGRSGIYSAYRTGRGHLTMRARVEFETTKRGSENIIITEFPYQVNKARTLERIAELVRDKKIVGISDIRDESDRNGIRVVVELKRDAVANVVLNQLYKHTQLQDTFGVIMIALVNRQPKLLNLKEMLTHFIEHRRVVITRRTLFDLDKAKAREHLLEGLKIAVDNIDEVVALIRKSASPAEAQTGLMARFSLSEVQAKAILDMRLHRLTGLERQKIVDELAEVRKEIERLIFIRDNEAEKYKIIKQESDEIAKKFGDERRTAIEEADGEELQDEDLIAEEDVVVILTQGGYIKRVPLDVYRAQRRGGKGVKSIDVKEEDVVVRVFVASTHSHLLIFTSAGKVYRVKAWEIPPASRVARGKSLVNFLGISAEEKVTGVFSIRDFNEAGRNLVLATKNGTVKKTALAEYANIHTKGIIAILLQEGDELAGVGITTGDSCIFIGSAQGQAIKFHEKDARAMGRRTAGVRGIELDEGDSVVGLEVITPDDVILTVTENGFGKRTPVSEYRLQSRGGKGVINIIASERNGKVVSLKSVKDDNEILLITTDGQAIRTRVNEISVIGRNTQGVKLLDTEGTSKVISLAVIEEDKD